ncbi:hypothetical protein CEXT_313861 [Caerostris extrusa]|uniref:Uncharacterized protein n=1 Tax=Caerostris extrusa TaxID=172846 RepID=A0AAV4QEW0_CAEEX|nr:hypothetical protein CEXT_313861 [Caerostris extrusa]
MFYFGEKLYLSEAAADSLRRVPLNSSDVAPSLRFALTKYRFVAAAAERVLFSGRFLEWNVVYDGIFIHKHKTMFYIQTSHSHYFLTTKPLSFKLLSLSKQISNFSSKKPSRPLPTPSEKKLPTTKTLQPPALFAGHAPLPTATVKNKLQEKPPGLNQTNPHPQNGILLNWNPIKNSRHARQSPIRKNISAGKFSSPSEHPPTPLSLPPPPPIPYPQPKTPKIVKLQNLEVIW